MGDDLRLIAEVKKASPSKGILNADLDPVQTAITYADNGAAVVSVLTESKHFLGSIDYLAAVKEALQPKGIPVLRKDFIFDPYQVHEARAYGADAILLIVAALEPEQLKKLMRVAQSLWMQCLVEVHDEAELQTALDVEAEVIGINNRDLRTFHTTLEVTERLAPLVPQGKIIVSESGIETRDDVQRLSELGVNAVLIGETLVTASDVGAKVREFTGAKERV
jgi:indole-3-glycerol phosphate synthase